MDDFAKALNAPDLEMAKRSSALLSAEREKKQLVAYIVKIEKEQKLLCEHVKQQDAVILQLRNELAEKN